RRLRPLNGYVKAVLQPSLIRGLCPGQKIPAGNPLTDWLSALYGAEARTATGVDADRGGGRKCREAGVPATRLCVWSTLSSDWRAVARPRIPFPAAFATQRTIAIENQEEQMNLRTLMWLNVALFVVSLAAVGWSSRPGPRWHPALVSAAQAKDVD